MVAFSACSRNRDSLDSMQQELLAHRQSVRDTAAARGVCRSWRHEVLGSQWRKAATPQPSDDSSPCRFSGTFSVGPRLASSCDAAQTAHWRLTPHTITTGSKTPSVESSSPSPKPRRTLRPPRWSIQTSSPTAQKTSIAQRASWRFVALAAAESRRAFTPPCPLISHPPEMWPPHDSHDRLQESELAMEGGSPTYSSHASPTAVSRASPTENRLRVLKLSDQAAPQQPDIDLRSAGLLDEMLNETATEGLPQEGSGLAVSGEPPCSHNNWDKVRVKKGSAALRCRDCGASWRVPSSLRKCPSFFCGYCPNGPGCALPHVHKYKNREREALEAQRQAALQAAAAAAARAHVASGEGAAGACFAVPAHVFMGGSPLPSPPQGSPSPRGQDFHVPQGSSPRSASPLAFELADGEVQQPRPCDHNNWDAVKLRKGRLTLRCRQCNKFWKLLSKSVRKCADFFAGYCPLGVLCPLVHVHRYKNQQKEAEKIRIAAEACHQRQAMCLLAASSTGCQSSARASPAAATPAPSPSPPPAPLCTFPAIVMRRELPTLPTIDVRTSTKRVPGEGEQKKKKKKKVVPPGCAVWNHVATRKLHTVGSGSWPLDVARVPPPPQEKDRPPQHWPQLLSGLVWPRRKI